MMLYCQNVFSKCIFKILIRTKCSSGKVIWSGCRYEDINI